MPNKWSEAEDNTLRQLVGFYDKETSVNWVEVAKRLPGRNNKDCRKRWTKISEKWQKGSWAHDENERLRDGVAQYGTKWITVAEVVGTRSPDQCQKRWQNALNPELAAAEWTPEQDEQLRSAVQAYGRNWSTIAKILSPKRSPLSLSNRYTSICAQGAGSSDTAASHSYMNDMSDTSWERDQHASPQVGPDGAAIADFRQWDSSYYDMPATSMPMVTSPVGYYDGQQTAFSYGGAAPIMAPYDPVDPHDMGSPQHEDMSEGMEYGQGGYTWQM